MVKQVVEYEILDTAEHAGEKAYEQIAKLLNEKAIAGWRVKSVIVRAPLVVLLERSVVENKGGK